MAISTGVITTGTDVADQTREFNKQLAATLAAIPSADEVDDPPRTRAERARGEGAFPAPVILPQGRDRTISGRAAPIPVRVFTPPTVDGAYLHIHGGGWVLGSQTAHDVMLWDLAQRAHLAVVSVGYRLAPEDPYPAGPDDCEDAARWLIEAAAGEFGTDRLAIGGESAGANLAVVTLLRLGELASAFRAAQLTFGAFDLSMTPSQRLWGQQNLVLSQPIMRWFCDKYLPGLDEEQRRRPDISPLYADLTGMPQARFVVGTQDPLLDDTLFMAARWRAAGNAAELEVVDEAVHGFTQFPLTIAERELARQAEFLTP
jgi:acetyl esterase/lipase